MKLVIQQYLSSLKESKELDALLPDLLLVMNIRPTVKPQIGVRQHGVDLAAIGKDSNDGMTKLFLFVIKCGDIGRKEWDSGIQSVRQTLNEIADSYIPHFIPAKHKDLPIVIVLTTGGNLLQDTQDLWNGYISNNETDKIKYELWDGARLSLLFHEHLFNENILIPEYRSLFRKALVMIEDPSYDLKDFYYLFDRFAERIDDSKTKSNIRNIKTCKLIFKIAIEWAKVANNYKHCINLAEHCLLKYWNTIKEFSLDKSSLLSTEFIDYYLTLYNLLVENNNKFADLYSTEDGLHGYTNLRSPETESLKVYEQLGFLSELGVLAFFEYCRYKKENYWQSLISVSENLKNLLTNHKSLLNPLYDEHIIEIYLCSYVLIVVGEKDFITDWLYKSFYHIIYAYDVLGKYYPACTNSFYDLIYESKENREELVCSSTLFFYYLQLACITKNEKLYTFIYDQLKECFVKTDIQFWYPDLNSEKYIYISNAGYKSGYGFVCDKIPKSITEMENLIIVKKDKEISYKDFSCFKNGFTDLLFISNRHFRTPIIPDTLLVLQKLEIRMKKNPIL